MLISFERVLKKQYMNFPTLLAGFTKCDNAANVFYTSKKESYHT